MSKLRLLTFNLLLSAILAGCAREAQPERATPQASSAVDSADASREVRYLALGDSFTIGTGSTPEEAFPARLAARWRAQGLAVTLENLGVNGYTTADVIERELPRLKGFRPTLVTLAVGANDFVHGASVAQYRDGVRAIFTAIAAAGVAPARVVALPQPDWSRSPVAASFGEPGAIALAIEERNGVLRDEAGRFGAQWIDLFPLMRREAGAKMIAADGLHPSVAAYDEWAAELAKQIVVP